MFSHLQNYNDWIRFLMPFTNEIADIFTQSGMISLYKHNPIGTYQTLIKAGIDYLSLAGIVWNVAYESLHNPEFPLEVGILKGLVLLAFAFLIPNLYMGDMLKRSCKYAKITCSKKGIVFFGILIIAGLLIFETVTHYYIEKLMIIELEKSNNNINRNEK
jgi:hypothetical protein